MRTERTGGRFLRFGHPRCKPGANPVQTCLVQVPRQLDRGLHLHVVLEEAAAEAWLLVLLALVLTVDSDLCRDSVTCVDMIRMRPILPLKVAE